MHTPKIPFHLRRPPSRALVTTLCACLAVSFALSGCISAGTPPPSWPAPILSEKDPCPDLSGSYENIGADAKGGKAVPLALILFPEASRNWTSAQVTTQRRFRNASHVRVAGPRRDGMKVEAWRGEDLLGSRERGVGLGDGFSCEGGALRVSLPATGDAVSGVFFDTFRSAAVMRASDGSLLVKTSGLGVGLGFYLIPLAAGVEGLAWYPRADGDDRAR